jgi:Phage portal protein
MQMNATQVAAILGLPPDRLGGTKGDSLTYSTVEQSTLQVIEALRPWLVRLEHAFFQILPANRYTRFDSDALLKTDLKTRTEIYKTQRDMGLRTTDELRDMEDLEPLPGKAGGENIPLEVMVAMSRSIRGIPNSMLDSITLEMDLAADRLEQLQKEGLAAAPVPGQPVVPGAEQMIAQVIGAQRSHDPGEREDAQLILDFLAARRRSRRMPRAEPEYVGAWIPSKRELVLSGVNGHGNHGADDHGAGP